MTPDPAPWTRDELDAMIPEDAELEAAIKAAMADFEAGAPVPIPKEVPEPRPLPPMDGDECFAYLMRLIALARHRPLTERECFLHGQLLSVYEQAAQAAALGYKGRYFVIPEEFIERQVKKGRLTPERFAELLKFAVKRRQALE